MSQDAAQFQYSYEASAFALADLALEQARAALAEAVPDAR